MAAIVANKPPSRYWFAICCDLVYNRLKLTDVEALTMLPTTEMVAYYDFSETQQTQTLRS